MKKIVIPTKVRKVISSKSRSTKDKYTALISELEEHPFDGPQYKLMKGEPLLKEAKRRGITKCVPHSVELENRLRLVYEVYQNEYIGDVNYELYIIITDVANHEWRGKPYTKQFSE